VAKGTIVLPKSVTPSRIKANLDGALKGKSSLTKEDVEKLDGLAASGKQKRFITPPWRTCLIHYSLSFESCFDRCFEFLAVDLGFANWPPLPQ